jgi:hypothetical protein
VRPKAGWYNQPIVCSAHGGGTIRPYSKIKRRRRRRIRRRKRRKRRRKKELSCWERGIT